MKKEYAKPEVISSKEVDGSGNTYLIEYFRHLQHYPFGGTVSLGLKLKTQAISPVETRRKLEITHGPSWFPV